MLSSATPDGSYKAGVELQLLVHFSEPVFYAGSGMLTLTLNTSLASNATLVGGSGSSVLTFALVIRSGDDTFGSLNQLSTSALQLQGDSTLLDGARNPAVLTLPAPGSGDALAQRARLVIDTVSAVVTRVRSTSIGGSYNAFTSLLVVLEWSEPVFLAPKLMGTPRLALNASLSSVALWVAGNGTRELSFNYTVWPGDMSSALDVANSSALTLSSGAWLWDGALNHATLTVPVHRTWWGGRAGDYCHLC